MERAVCESRAISPPDRTWTAQRLGSACLRQLTMNPFAAAALERGLAAPFNKPGLGFDVFQDQAFAQAILP